MECFRLYLIILKDEEDGMSPTGYNILTRDSIMLQSNLTNAVFFFIFVFHGDWIRSPSFHYTYELKSFELGAIGSDRKIMIYYYPRITQSPQVSDFAS